MKEREWLTSTSLGRYWASYLVSERGERIAGEVDVSEVLCGPTKADGRLGGGL